MARRWISLALVSWLLVFVVPAGCGPPEEAGEKGAGATEAAEQDPAAGNPTGEVPERAAEGAVRIVFLGDSLTAGYSLAEEDAFPARLEELLEAEGLPVEVINAGVSGDTTAGGLARIDWLLRQKPDVLVVGLGGNDGLRGLDLENTEKNLREIVSRACRAGARVLLLGMQIPPSYGPEYVEGFAAIYPRLEEELDVPRVPFLLEGVGGVPELNLPDGIHPTPEGHRIVAGTVLPYLEPLVRAALADGNAAAGS